MIYFSDEKIKQIAAGIIRLNVKTVAQIPIESMKQAFGLDKKKEGKDGE